MNLSELVKGGRATVLNVSDACELDPIARRIRELGFVAGATVEVVAKGFWGGNPLVVRVGNTRFALRKKEAQRILIEDQQ
ncbi:FeoA family protein [Zhongshania sp. BJYM1]|uniref:FeoA family protein n=1 Tax=Zhongshania aquatica TaxID=2965069 RepID=UPI0022B4FD53|nr:FeoA family protein [Marortus sp. BJYM1]